jgi:hypothetical protein
MPVIAAIIIVVLALLAGAAYFFRRKKAPGPGAQGMTMPPHENEHPAHAKMRDGGLQCENCGKAHEPGTPYCAKCGMKLS